MCDLLLGRVEGDFPLDTTDLFNGTIHITRQSFPTLRHDRTAGKSPRDRSALWALVQNQFRTETALLIKLPSKGQYGCKIPFDCDRVQQSFLESEKHVTDSCWFFWGIAIDVLSDLCPK